MAKKGQKFSYYSPELKAEAVRLYDEENLGYKTVAQILGVKSKTQIVDWVTKARTNKILDRKASALMLGRRKERFSSVEEELAYVKAERDYLKKLYRNLVGEVDQNN